MKTRSFNDVLKRLALLTGDYKELDDSELAEISDWASLLAARVCELWEDWEWNELCDIAEQNLEGEDTGYKYFSVPDGKMFLRAYGADPRKCDIPLPELRVRQFGDKIRVPSGCKDSVWVYWQDCAPDFSAASKPEIPAFLEDAAVELAYSDILAQNGQLAKSQVRRNIGYAARDRQMERQLRTRDKTMRIAK